MGGDTPQPRKVNTMKYYTKQEIDQVIDVVNGFEMTYGDYLDNTGVEYEVIS